MSILYCIPENLLVYDVVMDKIFTVDAFQTHLYNNASELRNNEIKTETKNSNIYYYGKTNDVCWYIGKNGNKIYFISLSNLVQESNPHVRLEKCLPEYNGGILDYGVEIVLTEYIIYDNTAHTTKWFASNYIQTKLCNIIFEHNVDKETEIHVPKTYSASPDDNIYVCEKKSDCCAVYKNHTHEFIVLKLKQVISQIRSEHLNPYLHAEPVLVQKSGRKSRKSLSRK